MVEKGPTDKNACLLSPLEDDVGLSEEAGKGQQPEQMARPAGVRWQPLQKDKVAAMQLEANQISQQTGKALSRRQLPSPPQSCLGLRAHCSQGLNGQRRRTAPSVGPRLRPHAPCCVLLVRSREVCFQEAGHRRCCFVAAPRPTIDHERCPAESCSVRDGRDRTT